MSVSEIIEKLDSIIDKVDSLENDISNQDYEIEVLEKKLIVIMRHFEIENRKVVFITQRKGPNRELIKRLVASKRYDYEKIAEIVGCSELELIGIIDEMSDAGARKG